MDSLASTDAFFASLQAEVATIEQEQAFDLNQAHNAGSTAFGAQENNWLKEEGGNQQEDGSVAVPAANGSANEVGTSEQPPGPGVPNGEHASGTRRKRNR